MYFLKSLLINFLVVFFADHILPGIQVTNQTKLPHIGDDMIFAAALGLLNALICPTLRLLRRDVTLLKVAAIALILNFGAFAVLKLLPVGINVLSVEGYILISVVVTIASFLTNFFDVKRHRVHHHTDTHQ